MTECKYFFYYTRTNELKCISKKAFCSSQANFICVSGNKIRIVGPIDKKIVLRKLREVNFEHFQAQGLYGDLNLMVDGITLLINALKKIGEVKKLASQLDKYVILDTVKLLVNLVDFLSKGISVSSLINFIIDSYLILERNVFKGQMLESVCLATFSMFLPKQLFEIVKRISLFSSSKFVDDFNGFHSLFISLVQVLEFFISYLSLPNCIAGCFRSVIDFLNIGKKHLLINDTKKLLKEAKKDSKCLLSDTFRLKIKQSYASCMEDSSIVEWKKKSSTIQQVCNEITSLYKRCLSYESTSRVEPVCFIFEGPPGCGKSMSMNKVLDALGMRKYSHLVKSNMDGKDWYDTYDNEEIFYMDDVGQQSISQFRTIINMVSEVKLPLDCADAKLKDTKFFSSEIILATTNCFQNLQGLTKDDCITDIKALWRRGFVFDFKDVKRDHFNNFSGKVDFKFFDVNNLLFKNEFPPAFQQYLQHNHITFNQLKEEMCCSKLLPTFCFNKNNFLDFIIWICTIVKHMNEMNKLRLSTNKLTDEELSMVQKCLNFTEVFVDAKEEKFEAQMLRNKGCIEMPIGQFSALQQIVSELEEGEECDFLIISKSKWYWRVFKEFLSDLSSFVLSFIKDHFDSQVFTMILTVGFMTLAFYLKENFFKVQRDFVGEAGSAWSKFDKSPHTSVDMISKNILPVKLYNDQVTTNSLALFSGHTFVLPCHVGVLNECYVTIFKDLDRTNKIMEHVKVHRIYKNEALDVSVYQMAKNIAVTFKNLSQHVKEGLDTGNLYLSNFKGSILTSSIKSDFEESRVYEVNLPNFPKFTNRFDKCNSVFYSVQEQGMCGSMLIDAFGGIRGMHVAGSKIKNVGVSILWSKEFLNILRNFFINDDNFILNCEMSDRVLPNMSVNKIQKDCHSVVPKATNFIPTSFFDKLNITRSPADLSKFGPCTVKDIAKKSFKPTAFVCQEELNFGSKLLSYYFENYEFRVLSDYEVIKGTELLAGLNKDSSNGYLCNKEKSYYINFVEGKFTDVFKKELDELELSILSGKPDWDKFVWCETLKDELRGDEKEGVPRSFRVGTIHQQVLMKKYFGWLVEDIMKTRETHQISVGINPYVEWPKIYNSLKQCSIVFAGDVASWDGGMLPQVQDAVASAILSVVSKKGNLSHISICSFLLEMTIRSIVSVLDDCFITTHSMPSGSYLTAIFNSLVNKFYTAMWYIRNVPNGTVTDFQLSIVDYVYGDDKLNGVKKNVDKLNAISMEKFFTSLGMGFTDSCKNPITKAAYSLDDVTFLKRSFRFHNILKRVTCPLDLRTLYSSLGYCDSSKDYDTVMNDKVNAFQREIYLHPERDFLINEFFEILEEHGMYFPRLTDSYLYNLFCKDFKVDYLIGFDKSIL